jgi:hypothetical protein
MGKMTREKQAEKETEGMVDVSGPIYAYRFAVRGNDFMRFHLSRNGEGIVLVDLRESPEGRLFREMIEPYINGDNGLLPTGVVEIIYSKRGVV